MGCLDLALQCFLAMLLRDLELALDFCFLLLELGVLPLDDELTRASLGGFDFGRDGLVSLLLS